MRSPEASSSTLDRIGMVVFFSTTPCDRLSSRTRSLLLTVNSMPQLLFFDGCIYLHDKNRIHRACENVDAYLNYTKLSHFPLRVLADSARVSLQKAAPPPDLHSFPPPQP